MYKLDLVTAPASEPVSVSEAKAHLRISSSNDDTYIGTLITVSRQAAELYTGRVFITQTWKMFLDEWPNSPSKEWWGGVRVGVITDFTRENKIELPLPPLQSVTHIKTYSDEDSATTLNSSNYYVSTYSGLSASYGSITLRNGSTWPSYTRCSDGIEIQFVAGYGNASDVPEQIKQGILDEIAFRYEHRGDRLDTNLVNSEIAEGLLSPFKIIKK